MTRRSLRKPKDRSPRRLINRIRKKASPHKQILIRTAILTVATFILYSFLGGEFGMLNLLRMQRKRSTLQMERRQLIAEIANLEDRYERAQTDTSYIEKIARERYGLVRDGEVVIRVPENLKYQPE